MRRVGRLAAALSAATVLSLAFAPSAFAHVRVTSDSAVRGEYATLQFSVPNESETKALTTELTVQLPNTGSASPELIPGWSTTVDRDADRGTVKSVTWKAAPGTGIGPDQFALFRLRVKLPDTDSVLFPATQTYSDGQVVAWDQPVPAGGPEPDHPAPALGLTAGEPGADDHDGHSHPAAKSSHADSTARWLGGIGLVLGAVALALSVQARLRKQP